MDFILEFLSQSKSTFIKKYTNPFFGGETFSSYLCGVFWKHEYWKTPKHQALSQMRAAVISGVAPADWQ